MCALILAIDKNIGKYSRLFWHVVKASIACIVEDDLVDEEETEQFSQEESDGSGLLYRIASDYESPKRDSSASDFSISDDQRSFDSSSSGEEADPSGGDSSSSPENDTGNLLIVSLGNNWRQWTK